MGMDQRCEDVWLALESAVSLRDYESVVSATDELRELVGPQATCRAEAERRRAAARSARECAKRNEALGLPMSAALDLRQASELDEEAIKLEAKAAELVEASR